MTTQQFGHQSSSKDTFEKYKVLWLKVLCIMKVHHFHIAFNPYFSSDDYLGRAGVNIQDSRRETETAYPAGKVKFINRWKTNP